MVHQVHDAEVAAPRVLGDDRVLDQGEIGLGAGQHAAPFLLGAVELVAAGRGDDRVRARRQMPVAPHLLPQRVGCLVGIGQRIGDAGEAGGLVPRLRLVHHMQNDGRKQVERRLAPVVLALDAVAVGIADHLRDVLRVGHLVRRAEPDLLQEVEPCAAGERAGFPAEHGAAALPAAPAGGQCPEFALLVIDQRARRP